FTSIDVSFISLDLILPPLYEILEENGEVAALIKPQFEAGREQVGKNGIIRDPKVHQMTIEKVLKTATQLGFSVKGLTFSPIKGGAGNVEFLVHLLKDGKAEIAQQVNIESVLQKESEEL
ncbi:MAG TPA: TlyA family rRNA (cytidine-2'-O)-methyltransferase, partial [Lactococcus lactis]|nr:TlyA family rRNA (cytidine-2'-O)-methyltransferase [Lactococcus lactis]